MNTKYLGQDKLIDYLKGQNNLSRLSYYGFLLHNRKVIIKSISSPDTWDSLNNMWITKFFKEAEQLFDKESYLNLKNKVDTENRRLNNKIRTLWEEIIDLYKKLNKENHNNTGRKRKCSKSSSVDPLVETIEISSDDESEIYSEINNNEYKDNLEVEFEVGPSITTTKFKSKKRTSNSVYPTEDSPMETWILPSGKSAVDVISGPSSLYKSHPSHMGIIRLGTKIQQPGWIGNDDWEYLQESVEYPKDSLGQTSPAEYSECLYNVKFDAKNKQMAFVVNVLRWFADVVFNPTSAFHCPCEQESILGSLLVHPILQYVSNIYNKHVYIPGEFYLQASANQRLIRRSLKPEDNKPLGLKIDGVFESTYSTGNKSVEFGMIEMSGGYNTDDFPRYLKDHVRGCWGMRDILNNIATMLPCGDYKVMRQLRTWFLHTHGLDVQLWGIDIPVKKVYRMFLLGTFRFPINWEDHYELMHALPILWNFGKGLSDSAEVLENLKKSHNRNSISSSKTLALKTYIRHIKQSPKKPIGKKARTINPMKREQLEDPPSPSPVFITRERYRENYIQRIVTRKEKKEDYVKNKAMALSFSTENYRKMFKQLDKLGEGSYGSVWKAFHLLDGKSYAVKKIDILNILRTELLGSQGS
ncbi:kinase-like domain-containing protein [Rhizophagus clarus]|uniref:non-specific serine/threonine protein kinase n=1 Tax=Rhizophagus clarus TaxID=94130 RepID=A0A8H3KPA9_9GLOM|nr:kinase-like domain-containing protein [Rhizophagus clarus]